MNSNPGGVPRQYGAGRRGQAVVPWAGRTLVVRAVLFGSCLSAALVLASAGARLAAAQNDAMPVGLDISVTPSLQSVARQEQVLLFVIVTNKSSVEVGNLTVGLSNDAFSPVELPTFPSSLPGFSSVQRTARIAPKASAKFAQQEVLLTFTYTWLLDGRQVQSAQGAAVSIQVTRRFDEESKGILGGNAAFLYLLLPIIPLFLGYQIVDRKALVGRLELPSLKTEYVLPAFLIAVVLNLVLLVAFRQLQVDYSDPVTMLSILAGPFLLGATIAGVRRFSRLRWLRWRYAESDSFIEYLRKTLLRPDAAETYEWVTGKDRDGESWHGILLEQPPGDAALGATLQVSRTVSSPSTDWLRREVFTADGSLRSDRKSREQLVKLLESRALTPAYMDRIQQGAGSEGRKDQPVWTRLKDFGVTDRDAKSLVTLT